MSAPTHPAESPHAPRIGAGWVLPTLLIVVGFIAVHPFDGPLAAGAARLRESLHGDFRRELEAWQQYGQAIAIIVTALVLWLLDPARRRRLLDLGLAVVLAEAVSQSSKMLIGRPRPRPQFNDPTTFLSPWGEYPVMVGNHYKLVHAWDKSAGANTDLWSMPSSHTLFAAMLSVFLVTLYPRLRWPALALTLLVAFGRVLFDAHWPTDVVVGAGLGWLIGRLVVPTYSGVRLLDWVWTRVIDRSAQPALPTLLAAERAMPNSGRRQRRQYRAQNR